MAKKSKKSKTIKEEKTMETKIENSNETVNEETVLTEEIKGEETVEETVKNTEETTENQEENVEEVNEETTETTENTEETSENSDESTESNTVIGKLSGCSKLYLRKEASKESDSLTIIEFDDEIIIDEENSTEDFYKVSVKGFEGYCVKEYVTIK